MVVSLRRKLRIYVLAFSGAGVPRVGIVATACDRRPRFRHRRCTSHAMLTSSKPCDSTQDDRCPVNVCNRLRGSVKVSTCAQSNRGTSLLGRMLFRRFGLLRIVAGSYVVDFS
ncbi:hypothetical protein DFP72DRAFT_888705, partial [Ephemerocybe angulata]